MLEDAVLALATLARENLTVLGPSGSQVCRRTNIPAVSDAHVEPLILAAVMFLCKRHSLEVPPSACLWYIWRLLSFAHTHPNRPSTNTRRARSFAGAASVARPSAAQSFLLALSGGYRRFVYAPGDGHSLVYSH